MCDGVKIDFTVQYENNGMKYFFLMKCGVREKFMYVCVAKIQGNVEHAMLERTVYMEVVMAAPMCL